MIVALMMIGVTCSILLPNIIALETKMKQTNSDVYVQMKLLEKIEMLLHGHSFSEERLQLKGVTYEFKQQNDKTYCVFKEGVQYVCEQLEMGQ